VRDEPKGLTVDQVSDALCEHWGLDLRDLTYAPVGFGSYHWHATKQDGGRWFVTADDLPAMPVFDGSDADANFDTFNAALLAVRDMRDAGLEFVVAPVPNNAGDVLVRLTSRWALAVYPHIEGELRGRERLPESAALIGRLHRAKPPVAIRRWEPAIPHRRVLDEALSQLDAAWHDGPFSEPCRALVKTSRRRLEATLARYESLAVRYAASLDGWVLTHGDSHGNNFIAGMDGRLHLIDWDGACLAPPERDLQTQLGYDHESLAAYEASSGWRPRPDAIELFSLLWMLADVCSYVRRFRTAHNGSEDDAKSWGGLEGYLTSLA
jgi:spectinomycin phosphotransferase